ncbi:alpha/beta fold hydrolase [Streptomyces sp. NPDC018693]|uniref:alpha/beta fold hydrolase n=1 Tax=unclassified Streptomyces TaxID=2593676 RepID=UPI0037A4A424
MSRPPSLTLPPRTRVRRLETARGPFAVLDSVPPGEVPQAGTVLMVPGFIGSKEDFLPLLQPLGEAGYRVVAVDGRGQHESPGPAEAAAYAQSELAADVLAQTEAVDTGGPLHLLGHSMGALIARAAVLSAPPPYPWASLTLMSTGPAAIQPDQQQRVRQLVEWLPVLGKEALWQEMQQAEGEAEVIELPVEVSEFLNLRWLNTVPEQLTTTGSWLVAEPDRVPELASVPLPKLVISGSTDYAWPVTWQDSMAARLGADRAVIPGADHSPNVERPAETARALVAFWEKVSARRRTTGSPSGRRG